MTRSMIDENKLQTLYLEEKMSGRRIAPVLGVSPATIYRRLLKLNIPIQGYSHPPWNKGQTKLNVTVAQLDKLTSEYFMPDIASIFGVQAPAVWKLCRRFGIKTKLRKRSQVGSANPFYSKRHSVRTKLILSKKAKERYINPEDHPSWKGGLSSQEYSHAFNQELKELIRKRDNYICQLCGLPECESFRKLDIHHIDYNKKNNLPSNLVSLCLSCNIGVNSKRKEWIKHFKNKSLFQSPLALNRGYK